LQLFYDFCWISGNYSEWRYIFGYDSSGTYEGIGADVVYFGPMGCQTGFYLLVRDANEQKVNAAVRDALSAILAHDGEVYGKSERECGNYRNLELAAAKAVAARFGAVFRGVTSYTP
jgi:S-ribosylhomocysteine lyase